MEQHSLLQTTVLIAVLGIGAQWLAWRVKIPAIILLVISGILAGPVFGWISPSEQFGELVEILVKLAVAVILFDGGLNLRLFELKRSQGVLKRLVLLGLPLSWVLGTVVCYFVAGLSLPVSFLLAAILVVTGPTVIMPLVRQTKLAPRISSLLKWEGIVNDPLGALLAVLVFEFYIGAHETSATLVVLSALGMALLAGIGLGAGAGYFLKYAFKYAIIPEFLKVPLILMLVILVYGACNIIQEEAGLLGVTVFGFVVGNVGLKIIHEVRRFKENITVFLVSAVFIVLTAGLKPVHLELLDWRSVAFLTCILFVVRPAAVWLATIGSEISWQERTLLAWIAPRGVVAASVAGLFAPRMIEEGYPDAGLLVPLVFAVVFLTVLLHGFSLAPLARRLGLAVRSQEGVVIVGANPWTTELAGTLKDMGIPVLLIDNSWHRLRDARLKGIPVYFGEILSESSEELVDLSEMGYLLAATDNDAYNALVCSSYATHFGRERVFQLAMHKPRGDQRALRSANRGRIAFGEGLRYETFLSQYYQGWRFQRTPITENFRFDDFMKASDGKAEPLLLIQKRGRVVFDTSQKTVQPEPGDMLLSYVAPEGEA